MTTTEPVLLEDGLLLHLGTVPDDVRLDEVAFEEAWASHPAAPPIIRVATWVGPAPRWKQAFVHDYEFSGQVSVALPTMPPWVDRVLKWARREIDGRLNGVLVNWYDAALGHYIGPHRDSTLGLTLGAPIVTVSFGQSRLCRMCEGSGREARDILLTDGSVLVIPWTTNRAWKHAVPRTRVPGRRISVTLRAFDK